jgi:hypothetical protein
LGQLNDHLQQARDNRRLAEVLLTAHAEDSGATTWAMTLAFYAAVHCIEARFARDGDHSRSHADRDSRMLETRYGIPEPVFDAYQRLQNWSENGRYKHQSFTADYVRSRGLPSLAVIAAFIHLDS